MEYITGANGFVGQNLSKKIDAVAIPHQDIQTFTLRPFNRFFFLSTYGNMADHKDHDMIIRANVDDLTSILRRCDKAFDSFVYISTSSVKLPTQTMYSRAKRAGEEICLAYREALDLPMLVIRPFSITGVGEQPNHLIPTLIRSCLYGEPMKFVPDPVHDYIDVEDFVDGVLNLSDNGVGGIFELGSGVQTSNDEVRKMVEDITGRRANITVVDRLRTYDTDRWVSDNFRARSWGWLPRKPLQVTIEEMVNDQKRKKSN